MEWIAMKMGGPNVPDLTPEAEGIMKVKRFINDGALDEVGLRHQTAIDEIREAKNLAQELSNKPFGSKAGRQIETNLSVALELLFAVYTPDQRDVQLEEARRAAEQEARGLEEEHEQQLRDEAHEQQLADWRRQANEAIRQEAPTWSDYDVFVSFGTHWVRDPDHVRELEEQEPLHQDLPFVNESMLRGLRASEAWERNRVEREVFQEILEEERARRLGRAANLRAEVASWTDDRVLNTFPDRRTEPILHYLVRQEQKMREIAL
jgi:hypothetical protein